MANIIFAGVGGQGLILTTRVVVEAALDAGLDVSGSDVYGLAQRGGAVWGMVRIGHKYFSPLVPKGKVNYLVAMEQLEGLRWLGHLAPKATAILNRFQAYPTPILLEKEEYPEDIPDIFKQAGHQVQDIDAPGLAKELGNIRLANTILVGALSKHLEIPQESWLKAISANVPPKTIDLNIKAFHQARKV